MGQRVPVAADNPRVQCRRVCETRANNTGADGSTFQAVRVTGTYDVYPLGVYQLILEFTIVRAVDVRAKPCNGLPHRARCNREHGGEAAAPVAGRVRACPDATGVRDHGFRRRCPRRVSLQPIRPPRRGRAGGRVLRGGPGSTASTKLQRSGDRGELETIMHAGVAGSDDVVAMSCTWPSNAQSPGNPGIVDAKTSFRPEVLEFVGGYPITPRGQAQKVLSF